MQIVKFYFNTGKWSPTRFEWLECLKFLSKDEQDKIIRPMRAEDCKFKLISSLLMRYTVRLLLNVDSGLIGIERTDEGRPYCTNSELVDFNTSHAGDYVIVGGILFNHKNKIRIGCDVMKIDTSSTKQLKTFERIKSKSFTQNEIKHIDAEQDANEKLLIFNRIWSFKESFYKARGDGINAGKKLAYIESSMSDCIKTLHCTTNTKLVADGKQNTGAKFFEELVDGHIMTVCLLDESSEFCKDFDIDYLNNVLFQELSIDEILSGLNQSYIGTNVIGEVYWEEYCHKTSQIPNLSFQASDISHSAS
jgi:phosphopantetheine--protein transferase-like protein